MMKRIVLLLIGLVFFASASYAERERPSAPSEREAMYAKFREARGAYLIKELQLTAEEAEGIMPILAELDDQKVALWREGKEMRKRIKDHDPQLTQDELKAYFERNLDNKVREAELERIYYKKCAQVLPLEKLVRLEYLNRRFVRSYFVGKHR